MSTLAIIVLHNPRLWRSDTVRLKLCFFEAILKRFHDGFSVTVANMYVDGKNGGRFTKQIVYMIPTLLVICTVHTNIVGSVNSRIDPARSVVSSVCIFLEARWGCAGRNVFNLTRNGRHFSNAPAL